MVEQIRRLIQAAARFTRVWAVVIVLVATASLSAQPAPVPLPPSAQRAYDAMASRFDANAAMDVVTFMSSAWRLAGNPGFNASIDHIRDLLVKAG